MSFNSILEIDKLSCSYTLQHDNVVLYVDKLRLPAGKIIFLLGASGSGKSTLLETLGLMNNTIASGDVKLFVDETTVCDFSKLWKEGNLDEISGIRRNYLSFIFQNTNLMENFTAYENICLSQMIKTNGSQEVAMGGAVDLMNQVGLPLQEVDTGKLSVNLSGGQRQRVSFVRALNNNFKLLLCDEPTGNLDEINANELLNIVKNNIGNHKTAIIVSHDISLALKYADQIVLITKNEEKGCGEILEGNIFLRDNWQNLGESQLAAFRKNLASNFMSDASKKQASGDTKSFNTESKKYYKELFSSKEGKVLFGKSYINLIILITIICITFIAIGFANGALSYLEMKYKDPFVRLLTIGIPWSKSSASSVEGITDRLNTLEVREKFLIDTVTAYKESPLPVFNVESGKSEFIKGRLISIDDPINTYLFNELNWVSGSKSFTDENDLGMVVSVKMLNRLGYPPDAKVIYIDNGDLDTTVNPAQKFMVPVPVRAVVKEIPGRNSYLVTNFFFISFINHEDCVFDFKVQSQRLLYFVEGDKSLAKDFGKEIQRLTANLALEETVPLNKGDFDDGYEDAETMDESFDSVEEYSPEPAAPATDSAMADSTGLPAPEFEKREYTVDVRYEDSCEVMSLGGYEVSVNLDAKPYFYGTTENINRQIVSSDFYKNHQNKIVRIFDYQSAPQLEEDFSNDYLCVIFNTNGLDSITAFSRFVFNELNEKQVKEQTNVIDVDAGAVQEKNNFNYISKMTWLISGLLIVFSILSISLFISNLLKTHLNKVKMNLGTFKAFGLSDKESVNIYLGIMVRFIVTGLVVSLVAAYALGNLIGLWFKNWLNIDDQVEYFQLFAGQTYFLIFIILIVTAVTSYLNITRILSKTPGDLIYNR